jgi:hypothetical protein
VKIKIRLNENIDCHCMQLELNWIAILIQLNLMGCKLVEQIQKGNFLLYLSTWEWDKQILVWNYSSNDLNLMKSKVVLPN